MIICSPEPEVQIIVDRDPVKISFEEWTRPRHFSRTIAKGPDTTTWIWNLHADATIAIVIPVIWRSPIKTLVLILVNSHYLSLVEWHVLSQCPFFQCLSDHTHIGPSAQVVWPTVGQEILNVVPVDNINPD